MLSIDTSHIHPPSPPLSLPSFPCLPLFLPPSLSLSLSSLPLSLSPSLPPSLSSSEAAVILSHLSLHASYIQGTTSFLLSHVKSSPDMLDPKMEPSEAEKLTSEISGAVTAVSSLHTEVQTLQNHIHRVRPCLVLSFSSHPSLFSFMALSLFSPSFPYSLFGCFFSIFLFLSFLSSPSISHPSSPFTSLSLTLSSFKSAGSRHTAATE